MATDSRAAKISAWLIDPRRWRQLVLLALAVQRQDRQLLLAVRVVDPHVQQEAVELGLGQVVGAFLLDGVLGGQHHEQLRQVVGLLAHGDLVLAHGLEQRRLHLGRRAVDLVGQQHIVEQRAGPELELAALLAVDVGADQVRRQQVGRELDAVEIALDALGERLHGSGLGQSRHALHEHVAVAEHAHQHGIDELLLADDARCEMRAQRIEYGCLHRAVLPDVVSSSK